jgi:hypothetical protein
MTSTALRRFVVLVALLGLALVRNDQAIAAEADVEILALDARNVREDPDRVVVTARIVRKR